MGKAKIEIPVGEKCGICQKPATEYCSYCMDEYDSAPRLVPVSFYCTDHYISVVETGNCCYGSEQVWGVTA